MKTLSALLALVALFVLACSGGTDPISKSDTSVSTDTSTSQDSSTSDDTSTSDGDASSDLDTSNTDLTTSDQSDTTVDIPEELPPTCPSTCPANMACTDAEVGCVCVVDALDCDSDPSNGCDALDTAEHCGTCEPGLKCDIPGVAQVCTVDVPGERGHCEAVCADGLVDFDGNLATTPTNGCESGLRELGTSTVTGLEGNVVRSHFERETFRLRVLTLDGASTLRLYELALGGNNQVNVVSSTEVGTVTTTANSVHLAASRDIVAVVWDFENMLFLSAVGDGTSTELLRAQEQYTLDVVERWNPGAYEADFVVAARTTTNVYRLVRVIFEPSPGPVSMECTAVGGGLDFCIDDELTLTYPVLALFGRELPEPWVLATGMGLHLFSLATSLQEVTSTIGFNMSYPVYQAQATEDSLLVLSGDKVFAYTRTGFPGQGGSPTLVQTAQVPLIHISPTMVVLDSQRTIVVNDVGLELVLTAGASSTTAELSVDAPFDALIVVLDYKVIAFRGAEATVYDMVLGTLDLP